MGKKRKFNRFIRWIKSDLPEDKSSVLLLGVTKLSSPKLQRRISNNTNNSGVRHNSIGKNRPHTLHFEFPATSTASSVDDTCYSNNNFTELKPLNNYAIILTENSQNIDKNLKPVTILPKKSSSFSSTKENTSPITSIKSSSSFSDNPGVGKLRNNSASTRKRVSFTEDTEALIKSRDTARRNRDLNVNIIDFQSENSFVELPVGYSNNYTIEDNKGSCQQCRKNSIVEVSDKEEIDDILNNISDELNIRPIIRRNSSLSGGGSQLSSPGHLEKFDEETDINEEENDIVLELNKKKLFRHSENDIYERLAPPSGSAAYRRKLSAPITPVKPDDVDIFLNEIIAELDIGPKIARSRTNSKQISEEDLTDINSSKINLSQSHTSGIVSSSTTTSSEQQPNPTINIHVDDNVSENSPTDINVPIVNTLGETEEISEANMDRSIDSIGSCSLDVDLSTDFSDSSRGSVSDCTLRSVSILTPISNGLNTAANRSSTQTPVGKIVNEPVTNTQPRTNDPIIRVTIDENSDTTQSATTGKKPSYLNLACCVNGYNNLTTYDSKLRENYRSGTSRSREVSPNRPDIVYNNASSNQMTRRDHSLYLLPPENTSRQTLSSPIRNYSNSNIKSPKMNNGTGSDTSYLLTNNNMSSITQKTTSFSSSRQNGSSSTKQNFFSTTTNSYMSVENRNFTKSMLFTGKDVVDTCLNKSPSKYSNFNNSSYKISTDRELLNNTVSSKSIINGGPRECNSDISINESRAKITPSKSFIQQRVERLYGPGALAQGFFIQTKLSPSPRKYEIDNNKKVDEVKKNLFDENEDDSLLNNTPSLPVLRHLRPEFRAQLPILSPKRTIINNESKVTNIPITLSNNTLHDLSNKNSGDVAINDTSLIENGRKDDGKELKKSKAIENLIQEPNENSKLLVESQLSNENLNEFLPAAPEVILPVIANSSDTNILHLTNGKENKQVDKIPPVDNCNISKNEKDGHYFLRLLKKETDRLLSLAEKAENELEEAIKNNLSDDALGYLRSASGKARLLVNQKMQQFEGLCHKNINQIAGEPFPTTAEDLQGFWDMVMLQITQVNDLFKDLDELRANDWVPTLKPKKSSTDITKTRSKTVIKKPLTTTTNIGSANSEIQRMKRDAQRKMMIEQKRKAMLEARKNNNTTIDGQNVEIFVAETNS